MLCDSMRRCITTMLNSISAVGGGDGLTLGPNESTGGSKPKSLLGSSHLLQGQPQVPGATARNAVKHPRGEAACPGVQVVVPRCFVIISLRCKTFVQGCRWWCRGRGKETSPESSRVQTTSASTCCTMMVTRRPSPRCKSGALCAAAALCWLLFLYRATGNAWQATPKQSC